MQANGTQAVYLPIDAAALRPLIEQVVSEVVTRIDSARPAMDGKLAFREAEAAAMLSMNEHQLRDERRRGRIAASIGPGRMILYTREDLLGYLSTRRVNERN